MRARPRDAAAAAPAEAPAPGAANAYLLRPRHGGPAADNAASADAGGEPASVIAWRHPRAEGVEGRCIGARSDPPVDARRAKRLAHRMRAVARHEGLPRRVAVSPARRCRAVGRWLRRFGFEVHTDARLREFDFGAWDGSRWDAVPRAEIDAWCGDFGGYAPGGGDTLVGFLARIRPLRACPPAPLMVTHGGVLSALDWLASSAGAVAPTGAREWPAAPACGRSLRWRSQAGVARARAAGRGAPGAGVLGS